MVNFIKKSVPAVMGIGAGAFVGVVAILLGQVLFTGQGIGTEPEPPEQIYFF
ncbi:MAG: hypothetical protein AAGH70_10810 [Pseudomonadota bacterium]